jgi:23S rRNA (cytidine1920-2'-O)/16S rRNA (cytidine1409-2'-O)-methyltransferase
LKLKKALDSFPITAENKVCADIGASSGGFTDCMLQHGAKKVYAIDVGYGQFDWGLRNDSRVVVMERTNARYMETSWFTENLEFAAMDVSFISIKLILKPLYEIMQYGGEVVALVKPQFEAGRSKVGKNGVVREESTHIEVLSEAANFSMQLGFEVVGMNFSPITGPKGNIEFLLALRKSNIQTIQDIESVVTDTVKQAHSSLHSQ